MTTDNSTNAANETLQDNRPLDAATNAATETLLDNRPLDAATNAATETLLDNRPLDAATNAANVASAREKEARRVEGIASDFVNACINMLVHEQLPPATRALWDAGTQLMGDQHSMQTRIGMALMLHALAQSPEALAHVAAELRAMLVDTAPGLEALKPKP